MAVADIIMDILQAVRDAMAYLHNPPPFSWVTTVATTFRVLALVLVIPCVLLTALDIASYLIVRTLGADSAHQADSATPAPHYGGPDGLASSLNISFDSQSRKAQNMKDLHSEMIAEGAESDSYFSTSSDGSSALSGEGLFSPPISRSSSPPISRHTSRINFLSPQDGDDGSVLRRRV
ncbi:hypothetical protein BU17DRAFT_94707 [Hysterangium stoloniferum]|nr:hypothetical protein BU17DRAFT_94707 [Hysterangium stoloniferum]